MLVAWHDGGFWTLLLLSIYLRWSASYSRSLPPRGWVGQVSGSLAAIEAQKRKPSSIRLLRTHATPPVQPWRLICVWGDRTLAQHKTPSGRSSAVGGRVTDSVDGVVVSGKDSIRTEVSIQPSGITSTQDHASDQEEGRRIM